MADLGRGVTGVETQPPLILYQKNKKKEKEKNQRDRGREKRKRERGVELAQHFSDIFLLPFHSYVHSSIMRCIYGLCLELKLAYFKNGFSTRNKPETNTGN